MSDADIILKVENLSKTYFSKHQPQRSIKDLFASPFKENEAEADCVDALKDISFELKRGESLGIIGPNGAGKSTLLKILSGVTSPTSGKATINGRVLSVLDIGTGFHPDLTGRENVYLNGEILGMSRKEIDLKYHEIVDFSGIGEFINRPVKQYSSGMYLRLAFSIVVTLDADLLLFDEVLAVGDREFQQKSVGKIYDLLYENKSIVLASHDNGAILNLTSKTGYLSMGSLITFDDSQMAITEMNKQSARKNAEIISRSNLSLPTVDNEVERALEELSQAEKNTADDLGVVILSIKTLNSQENPQDIFVWEDPVLLQLVYEIKDRSKEYVVGLMLKDLSDAKLSVFHTNLLNDTYKTSPGTYQITWEIPRKMLGNGMFSLDQMIVIDGKVAVRKVNVAHFTIEDEDDVVGNYRVTLPLKVENNVKIQTL